MADRSNPDFIRVNDTKGDEHVVSIRQIVEVREQSPNWQVILTVMGKGNPFLITDEEAQNTFKNLPGMEPKKKAKAGLV